MKYFFSEIPEKKYMKRVPYKERKKHGQIFTPMPISDLMAFWIANINGTKILDPALGLGIFIRSIIKDHKSKTKDFEFFGYEKDCMILKQTEELFQGSNVKTNFYNKDFLSDWEGEYDGIICNPPYLKFHDYENTNKISNFREKFKQNFSGLTNIYTLFLLKSLKQLNRGGRAAFIIPSEFMNADYGKEIKKYLKINATLRFIIVIDSNTGIFDDVITTSTILLFADDENSGDVQFIEVRNENDFNLLKSKLFFYPNQGIIGKVKRLDELDENKKWRIYYHESNGDKYKNLVPFSNYAKVSRGIATGANKYFGFSEKKKKKYKIKEKYLLPCLTKAADIKKSFFEISDFEKLRDFGKSVYLLNALDLDDPYLNSYIEKGVKEKIDKRYLTSHRTPWYSIENRPPAPILVKVFNRSELKFVRNEAELYNLTAFHCIYLKDTAKSKIDILMAYLLTDIAKQIFDDNRRDYGHGLKKFEPNDLNNSLIIDLDKIDKENENKIRDLLKQYKKNESENKSIEKIKKDLEIIFMSYLTSI